MLEIVLAHKVSKVFLLGYRGDDVIDIVSSSNWTAFNRYADDGLSILRRVTEHGTVKRRERIIKRSMIKRRQSGTFFSAMYSVVV